jgi:hypothetical protein
MPPVVHVLDFGLIEKDTQRLGGKTLVVGEDFIAQRGDPAKLLPSRRTSESGLFGCKTLCCVRFASTSQGRRPFVSTCMPASVFDRST